MTIRLYACIAGAALLCGCATRQTAALPDLAEEGQAAPGAAAGGRSGGCGGGRHVSTSPGGR